MSYLSEVLADSPLYYPRFGEPSGTTMTDSGPNAHTGGTYTNTPTLGTTGALLGDTDTAATFAGSAYGLFPSDASLNGLSAFTAVAWIKLTSTGLQQIVARDGSSGRSFQFRVSSAKLQFIRIPGTTITATSATTLTTGVWYHVAAVYNGTDIRLYINGALDGTPAACTGTMGTSTQELQVACRRSNTTNVITDQLQGVLDDLSVYGTALSSTRIAALYTAGTAPAASGTGSLSLSGSGAAGIGRTATAALSVSGSGAAAGADTGTGSLSLSGSGTGSGIQPASGTGSLSLSGTGSTTASSPASGTAALSLDTSGTATAPAGAAASIDLTATATPAGTAPTGTAAVSLSASGTAGSSQAGSGSGALSLNGTGLVLAPVSAAALLTLSAAEVAYASSQAFLELGVLTAEAFELYLTDLTNAFNGRRRRGRATAWVDRPPVTPGRTFGPRYDKALAYPTPDMDDGRPT